MNSRKPRFPEHHVSSDDQEEMRRLVMRTHARLMSKFGLNKRSVSERRLNRLLAYFMGKKNQ